MGQLYTIPLRNLTTYHTVYVRSDVLGCIGQLYIQVKPRDFPTPKRYPDGESRLLSSTVYVYSVFGHRVAQFALKPRRPFCTWTPLENIVCRGKRNG